MEIRTDPGSEIRISRRGALGLTAGAILLLGFRLPTNEPTYKTATGGFVPNAFVRLSEDGAITLTMPQVEMGQGVYTSIAMILAEELDAAFDQVRLEHAPPDAAHYSNPMLGMQATGNSNSVRAFWTPLRKAGAAARAMLVQAAAGLWRVDPASCRTEASQVFHDASGRSATYASLARRAAGLKPPADPPLKAPADFRIIGKSLKRIDTPGKADGSAVYGIDALPPGVRFATLAQSPVLGGKVAHADQAAAMAVAGVRQVVVLDDLVAVVGDHFWAAKQGLDALGVTWNDGANAAVTTDTIWNQTRAASAKQGAVAKKVGDAAGTLARGDVFEAAFEMPLLAHAPMEPLNCTIHVSGGGCEVWIGTQVIGRVQEAVAKEAGVPLERVTVHNHLIGGGFGRRLEPDMAAAATRIAMHVEGPVKIVWTREEDIRHDYYRPIYRDLLSARVENSRITGWKHRITGSAVMARFLPPVFKDGIDIDGVDSAIDIPYDIPNLQVEFTRDEPVGIHTGFWRGVGPNNNVFAIESFIDELAQRAGQDPVAFRRANLKNPRLRAALDKAVERSGWGTPLPPRCGRGVSAQVSFASFLVTIVECAVDDYGEVTLRRITSAIDTGIAVNPNTVVAQIQGGLIFGLTAALYGEITLEKGRVQQSNFHDYRMLRIDQIPVIDVHVIPSGEAPGGIGETGTTSSIPALRNAIYAATGVPLRRMPIDRAAIAKGAKA